MIALQKKPETAEVEPNTVFRNRLSLDEVQQHLDDLGWLRGVAYSRFQAFHDERDRAAARLFFALQQDAVYARDVITGGRAFADMQRRITVGVDFFQSPHAQAMARGLS